MAYSILVLALLTVQAHAYNSTTDYNDITCVYPISGNYGLVNRILSYILWLAALFGSTWTWPATVAIGYNMTYTTTATVHAFILAVTGHNSLYDLDAAGAWAVISVAAMVASPINWYSNKLRDTIYRPIFAWWGSLVSVGAICAVIPYLSDHPVEAPCYTVGSANITLLASESQLVGHEAFNCTYSCFGRKQPMREASEITVLLARRAYDGVQSRLQWFAPELCVMGLFFGLLTSCSAADRKRTKKELIKAAAESVPRNTTPKQRGAAQNSRVRAQEELRTGRYQQESNGCLLLHPAILPILIVFNEFYILTPAALPVNEKPFPFGQWGSWVAVGSALLAAFFKEWYSTRYEALQAELAADREEAKLQRRRLPRFDLESNADTDTGNFRQSKDTSDALDKAAKPWTIATPEPVAKPVVHHPPTWKTDLALTPLDKTVWGAWNSSEEYGTGPFHVGDISHMPLLGSQRPRPIEPYEYVGT